MCLASCSHLLPSQPCHDCACCLANYPVPGCSQVTTVAVLLGNGSVLVQGMTSHRSFFNAVISCSTASSSSLGSMHLLHQSGAGCVGQFYMWLSRLLPSDCARASVNPSEYSLLCSLNVQLLGASTLLGRAGNAVPIFVVQATAESYRACM